MDTATMRRIDARIGRPLCHLLTWHRQLSSEPPEPTGPPRRLAVIKLAEQGATVAAWPALQRATDLVGRENLFIVVFEENRFIVDEMDVVPHDHVLTVATHSRLGTAIGMLRVARRLRREQVDATVDFEFFSRASAILSYLSGARRRAGFHSWFGEGADRGDLMTHRLAVNSLAHASQTFLMLVRALEHPAGTLPALPPDPSPASTVPPPVARVSEAGISAARRLVADATGAPVDGPILLLNANTSDLIPLRQWPPDRYVELARRLLAEHRDSTVVFTGSPQEATAAADLAARVDSPRCVSLAGRTSMHDLLALYTAAELMITNDSGPAHYATLTSIDVVTLFGPESPAVFGARSPRSHHVWAGLACSPCVNAFNDRQTGCTNNLCMQSITVDEVVATSAEIVKRRMTAGGPIDLSPNPERARARTQPPTSG